MLQDIYWKRRSPIHKINLWTCDYALCMRSGVGFICFFLNSAKRLLTKCIDESNVQKVMVKCIFSVCIEDIFNTATLLGMHFSLFTPPISTLHRHIHSLLKRYFVLYFYWLTVHVLPNVKHIIFALVSWIHIDSILPFACHWYFDALQRCSGHITIRSHLLEPTYYQTGLTA